MEEVWGNISSLPSLHNPSPTTKPSSFAAFDGGGGTNFHDFFNIKDPYPDEARLLTAHHSASMIPGDLNHFPSNYPKMNNTQLGFVSSSTDKKRPSSAKNDDDSAGDRRRKRLIKNRESADRSRARRQAYTNELEKELADLKKENAKLRKQLQKVGILAAAATTIPATAQQLSSTKGTSLYRTLTATF